MSNTESAQTLIVKNMLLHSREGSGEHRLVDANALVEELLTWPIMVLVRKIRVSRSIWSGLLIRPPARSTSSRRKSHAPLLNLISNGFYAATKRKQLDQSEGYEPTLIVTTKNLGDRAEIRIRDNGTGIPPEVKEKMFNPFFTTKPAGEGTGLGLSISYDIVVKQHAGSIEVDAQPGEFD